MTAGLLSSFFLHSKKAIRCRYSGVKRLTQRTVYPILFPVVHLFPLLRRPVSTLLSNRPALSPYSWYTVLPQIIMRYWRGLKTERQEESGENYIMTSLMICTANIFRVIKWRTMRWVGHVVCIWDWKGVCRVLVWKPEGNRTLGRPRCRWEDNIKMDLQEVGCEGMDWIDLAQDMDRCRVLVNAVMKFRGSLNARNFLTS